VAGFGAPQPNAFGQEKAAQEQPAQDDKEEPKDEKTEEEKAPPKPPSPLLLELGWTDWNVRTNFTKFRQYATPPRGFFLRELRYDPLASPQGYQGLLSLKALFEDDYFSEGRFDYAYGLTRLEGYARRNRYFIPTTPFPIPLSERRIQEGTFKQFLSRDVALSLRFSEDDQTQNFESPRPFQVQKTRYSDALVGGKLGNGRIETGFSTWRFYDRTTVLRDTRLDRWQILYAWDALPYLGVEGSYSRFWLDQPGAPSSEVEALSFAGDLAFGRTTDLSVAWRRTKLSLPVVHNAWSREQQIGTARITQKWRNWSLQFGVRQREVERIRGDQTFVDVPRWLTFEGRLTGRLHKQVRLTLRGAWEDLQSAPPMVTDDPRPLFWGGRKHAQVRLEGGNTDVGGYASYTFRRWENDPRGVRIESNAWLVGAHWQVTPALGFFAEYLKESWTGRSASNVFPTLDLFEPDTHTVVIGTTWVVDARTYLSVQYTEYGTANQNPLRLPDGNTGVRNFTIEARYRFPAGHEIGFVVAPWSYSDRIVPLMDYHTTVILLTGSARF
jgi:hypothetical protein